MSSGRGRVGGAVFVVEQRVGDAAHPRHRGVAAPALVAMVEAASHEHRRPVGALHPTLQPLCHPAGHTQLGEHHHPGAGGRHPGDQCVEQPLLGCLVGGADREQPASTALAQDELVDAAVGMAGGDHRRGIGEVREGPGQVVVKGHRELLGPPAGQADMAGLVQPVGQPPRRGGEPHVHHLAQPRIVEGQGIPDGQLDRAAPPKRPAEAVGVAGVEQLGQHVGGDAQRVLTLVMGVARVEHAIRRPFGGLGLDGAGGPVGLGAGGRCVPATDVGAVFVFRHGVLLSILLRGWVTPSPSGNG